MKRSDKQGMTLLETVLDIIVAIIIIIILFYVSAAIFGIFFGEKQKAQAQGQLDEIIKVVQASKLSGERFGFLLQSPKGWKLVSFYNGENPDAEKSAICGNANCICACPDPLLGKPNCAKGLCKIIDSPIYFSGTAFVIPIELKDMCIEHKSDSYILTEEKCQLATSVDTIINEKRAIDKVSGVLEQAKTQSLATKEKEKKCNCGSECLNYATKIVENSEKYRIPDPLLVASIIIFESECKSDFSYGKRFGLMGTPEIDNWQEYSINIDAGTSNLKQAFDLMSETSPEYIVCGNAYADNWKRTIRYYRRNACEDTNYVDNVMQIYSQLVQIAGKQSTGTTSS